MNKKRILFRNTLEERLRLSDLKEGDEACIESFEGDESGLVRLRDMGVHEGIAFRLIKFAPLGDPIEIKIRGFYLSIQKSLAKHIVIKRKLMVSSDKI